MAAFKYNVSVVSVSICLQANNILESHFNMILYRRKPYISKISLWQQIGNFLNLSIIILLSQFCRDNWKMYYT